MNLGKTIGGIALAGTLLTGCGGGNKGTTSEDVDSTLECTITQVGKITENNATVNTKCEDPDGITLGRIVVDGQIIELIIPENTTEFDIKTTIEKLPSDQNTSLELEVGSVNGETGETDLNTFTGEVETKSPEIIDTEKPTITLNGPSTITLTVGDTYTEQGAEANDNVDGNLTNEIIIDNLNVDTSFAGTYTVTYTVVDSSGNETTVTRTVVVNEKVNHAPVLNSVSVSGDTIGNIQGNDYYVAQNTDVIVHFQANGSDEDGDNLQIEINGVLYNGTFADININLAQDEIKEFYIKEYDGKKYSNEILVRIVGS